MEKNLEHPEITRCRETGYPSWMNPKEEDYDQDAYEIYCDRCYEEYKDSLIFGED